MSTDVDSRSGGLEERRWEFSGESPGPPVDYVQGPIYATVLGADLLGLRNIAIEAHFEQRAVGTIALSRSTPLSLLSVMPPRGMPLLRPGASGFNAGLQREHPNSSAACGATCLGRGGLLASEAVGAHQRKEKQGLCRVPFGRCSMRGNTEEEGEEGRMVN